MSTMLSAKPRLSLARCPHRSLRDCKSQPVSRRVGRLRLESQLGDHAGDRRANIFFYAPPPFRGFLLLMLESGAKAGPKPERNSYGALRN